MGRSGSSAAVGPLLEALDYHDEELEVDDDNCFEIRWAAAEALGWLGDRTAVPGLVEMLRETTDDEVAWAAAWSLGRLGDERAIQPLIDAMRGSYGPYRAEAAMWALVGFDDRQIDREIDAVQDRKRARVVPGHPVPSVAELRAARVWEQRM